jgi:hypothetical protein
MKCKKCNNDHNGVYGSGKFCSEKCARSFSSFLKRKEINEKVSKKLKGRKVGGGIGFRKGYDPNRHVFTQEDVIKQKIKTKEYREEKVKNTPFEKLTKTFRKKILLKEQNGKCLRCHISSWLDQPITLQIDHIDGNNRNNNRENSRLLCPNCHSQTETYCSKNKKFTSIGRFTNDEVIDAIKSTSSINQALNKLGVNGKMYYRVKKLKDMLNK